MEPTLNKSDLILDFKLMILICFDAFNEETISLSSMQLQHYRECRQKIIEIKISVLIVSGYSPSSIVYQLRAPDWTTHRCTVYERYKTMQNRSI